MSAPTILVTGASGMLGGAVATALRDRGATVRAFQRRPAGIDGVEVVVDKMSSPYLAGAVIDFSDTIEKQGFTIDNPNAGSSCACGDSFG